MNGIHATGRGQYSYSDCRGISYRENCACPKALGEVWIPYLSIDHLKMGLIRSRYTSLTPIRSDRELTDYLWPVVRGMIKAVIENGQNLIVEGCYIPFDWAKDFSEEYRVLIQYCCLIMSEAYIRSYYQDIKRYANAVEHRIDDTDCTLETLLRDNAQVLESCLKYGAEYILIGSTYHVDI